MKNLTEETLTMIFEQFPVYQPLKDGINELVTPSHGVVTGFSELLRDIETLMAIDLDETAPF